MAAWAESAVPAPPFRNKMIYLDAALFPVLLLGSPISTGALIGNLY